MKKYKVIHILNQFLPQVTGYAIRSKEIIEWTKPFTRSRVITKKTEPSWPGNEKISGIPVTRIFQYPIFFVRGLDPYLRQFGAIYRSDWGKKWRVDKWFPIVIAPIWLADNFRARVLQRVTDDLIFKNIVRKFKPDIVHAHTPFYMSLPMIKIAKQMNIPTIYEVRGVWEDTKVVEGVEEAGNKNYQDMRNLETETMRLADRVVVISEGLKKDILERGIAKNKIDLVPNSVDISGFKPIKKDSTLVKKLKLEGKTVLGYIGTIRRFEGLQYIVSALAKIKDQNLVFLVVGYGEYESSLKQLAKKLKVEDRVIFSGKVNPSEVAKYYSVIDICVYPRIRARVCEIVTPLKPLEAMAMGKFVLASDVGGLKEMVVDNISGATFRADDLSDLIKKIKQYQIQKKRDKIAQSSRIWVSKNRNWQVTAKKYQKIYRAFFKN